jgi:hypothetical protein
MSASERGYCPHQTASTAIRLLSVGLVLQLYVDPRIKAAVAMVPFAADFVPESLAHPKIALGLVIADKDVNQVPRCHAEKILEACAPRGELVMR